MPEDQLHRVLSEHQIMPSSGFTASVMDAVRREASAPPPIAFPWKRALPGLAAAALAVTLLVIAVVVQLFRGTETPALPPAGTADLAPILQAITRAGGHWAILALLLSWGSVKLSKAFSLRRT